MSQALATGARALGPRGNETPSADHSDASTAAAVDAPAGHELATGAAGPPAPRAASGMAEAVSAVPSAPTMDVPTAGGAKRPDSPPTPRADRGARSRGAAAAAVRETSEAPASSHAPARSEAPAASEAPAVVTPDIPAPQSVPDAPREPGPATADTRRVETTPQEHTAPSAKAPTPGETSADASTRASAAPTPRALPRETTPAGQRRLVRVPLSVRWRDLDAFNHVNNSKYLSYLEEARLRWMLAIPGMGLDEHVAPVVAASNLNYRRPIGWPGDVHVELFVERIGGSSLTIGHRIVDANDGGAVYCDGNVVMVWIDRESGRAAPLPQSVRTACA